MSQPAQSEILFPERCGRMRAEIGHIASTAEAAARDLQWWPQRLVEALKEIQQLAEATLAADTRLRNEQYLDR